ncbi:class I SAM-dependent methyltransferase [Helicobacter marmotae]|uniref:Class I SAM-dependent methyltransferase n=1 Tax=Helicobacter marmotae TaxID=152490 RepID=A0A3D8I6U2_9HELI|nr:class I SAM-dependent methyltransferase [Helicobacter marmotae]RDU60464.1 class I SAM-dependent methyltransferase [Helicobacter marmotae]
MNCILCHSPNTTITQKCKKEDLQALYKRSFGVDISHIVQSDIIYHTCLDCDLKFFTCEDGSIPTGDNNFYNALNTLDWYYFAQKHEYAYAQNFIAPNARVLEVGCGRAAFAQYLPEGAKEHYVGLELSTGAKDMAQKAGICIENVTIESYAKALKDPKNNGFDVACSFQVLEHVNNPHSFIQSQIHCLRWQNFNGGGEEHNPLLIIAVPSEDSFIQYCVNGILNMPPHHISRFSDTTLRHIARIFNLKLLSIYHEPIQKEHIDFYKATMWAKALHPHLRQTPLVDRGIMRKVINKLGILGKHFVKIPPNAYGHTAVAIYTLKESL